MTNSTTATTTTTTAVKYVYYCVFPVASSLGLRLNRSFGEGGGGGRNNGGKEERSAPGEEKPPIRPSRVRTRNTLTQNPKRMMEETGRLQQEEGGAVGGRLHTARQPHMPIGAHKSENIPDISVARHSLFLQNWRRHQIKGGGMTGTGGVATICKGNNKGE